MGMFSWICKGCGGELCEGELARLNGCKGVYDGYGRNDGGFDHSRANNAPAGWHEVCYQDAEDKDKLDETPSKSAPNQGMDYPKEKFVPNPELTTGYSIVIDREESLKTFILNQFGKVQEVGNWDEQETWYKENLYDLPPEEVAEVERKKSPFKPKVFKELEDAEAFAVVIAEKDEYFSVKILAETDKNGHNGLVLVVKEHGIKF